MIAEQYISLKTAQMLKEAKFDVPCRRHYTKSGSTWETAVPETIDESRDFTWFPCPTQALAARWLRDEKKIFIEVSMFWIGNWTYCVKNKNGIERKKIIYNSNFRTYEQALEAGLKHGLELVKK